VPAVVVAPVGRRGCGYREVVNTPTEPQRDHAPDDADGQVSEVASFKNAGEPISPGDAVAGAPEGESGQVDEGPTGPDAPTNDPRQDRHPAKDDVETTG
jgi:hypothetical protein